MTIDVISLSKGARVEIWARAKMAGTNAIRFEIDGSTVFAVPNMSTNWEYYEYRHRESGAITLIWDPDALEVSFAYSYDPATVNAEGIKLWTFADGTLSRRQGTELNDFIRADRTRPQLHFSPAIAWMNDPNGLCKVGDTWHLFYQFHPNGTDWGPMHWGHASSRDLFHWTLLPVFLHPTQNLDRLGATGGAFSGNAFRDLDGTLSFYYTERLPAYDLSKGYREVQKRAWPDARLLKAERITDVLQDRPDGVFHDFRDPKVWWDAAAGAYRMVLGASLHGDPAVLLYGSSDGQNWSYLGPLYRAPEKFKSEGARAVECPDFFPLDGKWVLIMGFVGHTEPATGRHNLLFALVGDFVGDLFTPGPLGLQMLDFGTDYYAMQSFEADGRQIALAWLFNWESRKPAGSPYSGEMSLPRELSLDGQSRLCMRPAAELGTAAPALAMVPAADGSFAPVPAQPFDITLSGLLDGTLIEATQAGAISFSVEITKGVVSISLPQDDGKIQYLANLGGATDLRIFHDCGIIEVFSANGAVCGTRRNYVNTFPDRVMVETTASASGRQRMK
jgi:beta-fructofuranosidase